MREHTITREVGAAVERTPLAEEHTRLALAEERTRIAREIHDTLAQGLAAIGLEIEGALRHLEEHPDRARERLERALATTRESLEDARRSVRGLRAAPLVGRALVEALAALGGSVTSATGVRVRVRSESDGSIPPRVEAEVYRIAQEALANVSKHARAAEVEVHLRITQDDVVLVIRDDGVGMPTSCIGEGHHGLLGMQERVRLLGGLLRVSSKAGRGTSITARVPLGPKPPGPPPRRASRAPQPAA